MVRHPPPDHPGGVKSSPASPDPIPLWGRGADLNQSTSPHPSPRNPSAPRPRPHGRQPACNTDPAASRRSPSRSCTDARAQAVRRTARCNRSATSSSPNAAPRCAKLSPSASAGKPLARPRMPCCTRGPKPNATADGARAVHEQRAPSGERERHVPGKATGTPCCCASVPTSGMPVCGPKQPLTSPGCIRRPSPISAPITPIRGPRSAESLSGSPKAARRRRL